MTLRDKLLIENSCLFYTKDEIIYRIKFEKLWLNYNISTIEDSAITKDYILISPDIDYFSFYSIEGCQISQVNKEDIPRAIAEALEKEDFDEEVFIPNKDLTISAKFYALAFEEVFQKLDIKKISKMNYDISLCHYQDRSLLKLIKILNIFKWESQELQLTINWEVKTLQPYLDLLQYPFTKVVLYFQYDSYSKNILRMNAHEKKLFKDTLLQSKF